MLKELYLKIFNMKIVRENLFEAFREESDPIEDMDIGIVECPYCNGYGYTDEHDPDSYDNETGEHDCSNCPIQVPCEDCSALGLIERKKLINLKYSKHSTNSTNNLPF